MTIQSEEPMNDRKLILDVDTGIDDALALAYLATFDDVNLLGVVGTYGNVAMGKARSQYAVCAGAVGAPARSSDARIVASILGCIIHS